MANTNLKANLMANMIFEKYSKNAGWCISIYYIKSFSFGFHIHKIIKVLEISLGKINIMIGAPLK